MELHIYKGFDNKFLNNIKYKSLIKINENYKTNFLAWDFKKTALEIDKKLTENIEKNDKFWITYDEFSLIGVKERIFYLIEFNDLKVTIIENNFYPDFYKTELDLKDYYDEINKWISSEKEVNLNEECKKITSIYSDIIRINDIFYASYYNFELDFDKIKVKSYYSELVKIKTNSNVNPDKFVFINNDIKNYLIFFADLIKSNANLIGVRCLDTPISNMILDSLRAYCFQNSINIVKKFDGFENEKILSNELISIAQNDLSYENFQFRNIEFYKDPDFTNETILISQSKIMSDIIEQAEMAQTENNQFRDIFITAPTGAGKSVLFQIPAIYLGKKHKKLTIIIEPIIALMEDQRSVLKSRGFNRVEVINSNIISPADKEKAIKRIQDGEVDLLYLSPETLLSYSIDKIIGTREIGLMVIDEAHIVTSWGQNFRPDYWYLGAYINRLRSESKYKRNFKKYSFPICTFTATAINGGLDDSIDETMISLNMKNPIRYIGKIIRPDIKFDISIRSPKKIDQDEYNLRKVDDVIKRIKNWINLNDKTIVYFPYVTLAQNAFSGYGLFDNNGFAETNKVGLYTGRNIDETITAEEFVYLKNQVLAKFRKGEINTVFATKAFGMGVDINDIKNVYHYAISGNLCDYVQEIGRAARKENIVGIASTDFYENDMSYVKKLYGMSQIHQYQINEVIALIYDAWKTKSKTNKNVRNFLISPESFTHIFASNNKNQNNTDDLINKVKTCLLMIEKDFDNKYPYKVMISRPRSLFTKAFVAVRKKENDFIMKSKYKEFFVKIKEMFSNEMQCDVIIYRLSLDLIWEKYFTNISMAEFKYYFFKAKNFNLTTANYLALKNEKPKIEIMPEIIDYFFIKQQVNIETKGNLLIENLKSQILSDFEYLANIISNNFYNKYFTLEQLTKKISNKYGLTRSKIIANSLFQIIDPNCRHIKFRNEGGNISYILKTHQLNNVLRRFIQSCDIFEKFENNKTKEYSNYMTFTQGSYNFDMLKILSMFNYIGYEILGGENPEIFIRLNSPFKFESIVKQKTKYSNDFATKAIEKHDRDVKVMQKFFCKLKKDKERWEYIENYFLGKNVLE